MFRFNLGPFLQGQMRIAKVKSATSLFLVPEFCIAKPTFRKSWPKNVFDVPHRQG